MRIKGKKRKFIKKTLSHLIITRRSFLFAKDACNLINKLRPKRHSHEYTHWYSSIIVAYGKPFVKNKPYGVLPRKWLRLLTKTERTFHKKFLRYRNKITAHSDRDEHEIRIVPPGYKDINTGKLYEYFAVRTRFQGISENDLKNLENLIDKFVKGMNKEVKNILDTLYSGEKIPRAPFLLEINEKL